MSTYSPRVERNRRLYQRRRIFLGLGLLLTALVVWAGARLYQFWNAPLTEIDPPLGGDQLAEAAPELADKNHFTVLLLGADMRPGDIGRSDTIMVAFVDLEKSQVKLLSFPRDSYVEIPGRGWDKINAAFADGGAKLVKQTYPKTDGVSEAKLNATFATGGARLVKKTVENVIGMPLDYWVAIDMGGFADIVDAVGGIDVVIDKDMDYEDPWDTPPLYIHLKAGAQRLQGTDALHYVRFRHDAQSDWGRMARQQQAIKALVQAAMRPANLTRVPQLLKLGLENVHTNMSPAQATSMANIAKKTLSGESITSVSLAGEDLWAPKDPQDPMSSETYYTVLDFAKMRELVREMSGQSVSQAQIERDRKDTLAYEKAIPFGSVLSGGWRQGLGGSDVADQRPPGDEDPIQPDDEDLNGPDDEEDPPDDDDEFPPGEGAQSPPGNGDEEPPGEGDEGRVGEESPPDGADPPPPTGGRSAG